MRYSQVRQPVATIAGVNNELEKIANSIDDMVSRKAGDGPNTLDATLDANSQRIINLPEPTTNTEPVRKADFDELGNKLRSDVYDAVRDAEDATDAANAAANSANAAASNANSAADNANTAASNAYQAIADLESDGYAVINQIESDGQSALDALRVINAGSFEDGATLTARNEVLYYLAEQTYYRWDGALPKTVAAASTPASTGGVGVGAWVDVGDATVRSELADPDKGAAMVGMKQIPSGEGRSVAQKLSDIAIVTPSDVGAPTDGDTNATPFLQKAIDGLPDGGVLDLMGGTYRIQKGAAHPAYPNSDQPCLVVYGKKNVTIKNGTLLVKEHGLGAIDFNLCENAKAENLICVGAGNFPPLDGMTGRGEKGRENAGYFDLTLYNSAVKRNNSVDTSSYSGGGYGGNFPQWGGGTAATWGVWNGGFIWNHGFGIAFIDCVNGVADGCDVSLFNGSGIYCVGGGSIHVKNCHIHGNYIGGVEVFASAPTQADLVAVTNNIIENNGHPQSTTSDEQLDPGYGFTINRGTRPPRQVEVKGNIFRGNKRKGVDAHSFDNILVEGNKISSSGYGVAVVISDSFSVGGSAVITSNTIHDIDYGTGGRGHAIQFAYPEGDVIVSQNHIIDIGSPESHIKDYYSYGISITAANTCVVEGNTIMNSAGMRADVGISVGQTAPDIIRLSTISSNIIKGSFERGILGAINSSSASYTDGNIINLENIDGLAQTGLQGIYGSTGRNLINIPRDGTNNKFSRHSPAYRLHVGISFPDLTVTGVTLDGIILSQSIECTASAIPQGFVLHLDPRLNINAKNLHVRYISSRVETGVVNDPVVDSITLRSTDPDNSTISFTMTSMVTGSVYSGANVDGWIEVSVDL